MANYINDFTEHNAWARALNPDYPTPSGRILNIADLNNADCIINLADKKHHYKLLWLLPCWKKKYIEWDIGQDVWDYPEHPELRAIIEREWGDICLNNGIS